MTVERCTLAVALSVSLVIAAPPARAQDCTNDVPAPVGFLADPTPLPGAAGYCARGQIAFTVVDFPAAEFTALQESASDELRYRIFALGNTANRNHAQAQVQYYLPSSGPAIYIIKLVGGACVECNCCYCNQTGFDESLAGWCASGVGRPGSPELVVGDTYVVSWDSASGELAINGQPLAASIPVPFAFDSYCLGSDCGLTMWNVPPNVLSNATLTIETDQTFCTEWVTTPPASCPCTCSPGEVDDRACGDCGTQTRTCPEACTWSEWSTCEPETCVSGDGGVPSDAGESSDAAHDSTEPARPAASNCGCGTLGATLGAGIVSSVLWLVPYLGFLFLLVLRRGRCRPSRGLRPIPSAAPTRKKS